MILCPWRGDLGAGLVAGRASKVGIAARDQLLGYELRLALVVDFGIAQRGLSSGEAGTRAVHLRRALRDLRLVGARVDARDHLPLADTVVEVSQHVGDLPGDLAADIDGGDRRQGAGRRDRDADVTTLDLGGAVGALAASLCVLQYTPGARDHHMAAMSVKSVCGWKGGAETRLAHAEESAWETSGHYAGCRGS